MVYNDILLFKDMCFTMAWENMLLPWLWQWFTMFSLHYGSILDHQYGMKKHDHEITMGNHAQPWKHGFQYTWESMSLSIFRNIFVINVQL